ALAPARATTLPAGVAATQTACSNHAGRAAGAAQGDTPTYFTQEEWAFINAAVDHLIPADEYGPGAIEAGVPEFIDRQMETPYGHGQLWYMQGPFRPSPAPEMGYQLRQKPADADPH